MSETETGKTRIQEMLATLVAVETLNRNDKNFLCNQDSCNSMQVEYLSEINRLICNNFYDRDDMRQAFMHGRTFEINDTDDGSEVDIRKSPTKNLPFAEWLNKYKK